MIHVFLHEKHFEGCAGLRITDEIRVTIAAQACLIALRLGDDAYRRLRTILVYPSAYVAQAKSVGPAGIVTESAMLRLGESWQQGTSFGGAVAGPVVLSWDDVRRGACDVRDGLNVVFHEFAHQLDAQSGGMEGAPALDRASMYTAWADVLGREYENLRRAATIGQPTLIRKYGATNPAEFFAVATEHFFEQPRQLHALHPDLYEQLAAFYKQDPAALAEPSPEHACAPGPT